MNHLCISCASLNSLLNTTLQARPAGVSIRTASEECWRVTRHAEQSELARSTVTTRDVARRRLFVRPDDVCSQSTDHAVIIGTCLFSSRQSVRAAVVVVTVPARRYADRSLEIK